MASDPILTAIMVDTKTGDRQEVHANDLYRHPSLSKPFQKAVGVQHEFFCADCSKKGHKVRLNFISASERSFTLQQLDRNTSAPLNKTGTEAPLEKTKNFHLPNHFTRRAGEPRHKCDQSARYAPLRRWATKFNATEIATGSFVFPIDLVGRRLHHNEEACLGDIRSTVRYKNQDMGGITTAHEFGILLEELTQDPTARSQQYFHDGLRPRAFHETYFETLEDMHGYLSGNPQGLGRDRRSAIIIAALLQPNTYYKVAMEHSFDNIFVDRRHPTIAPAQGGTIELACHLQTNTKPIYDAARRCAAVHKDNPNGYILVLGEAYLNPAQKGRIVIDIFNADQIVAQAQKTGFTPPISADNQMNLAL